MKTLKIIGASLATALLLAACGGSPTLSGSSTGPTKTAGTKTVTVAASPTTIAGDGSTTAAVTAIARDANNAGVSGVIVSFGATSGLISPATATTDSSGTATATLSAAGVASGTNITVAAAVGTIQGSTTVGVVAIQQTLTLSETTPQIPSDSSTGATVNALLRDANNNVLPGIKVQFSSSSGALTPVQTTAGAAAASPVPAGTTDVNGVAAALVTAGNDPTNRRVTVTAVAGSAPTTTIPIDVSGTSLTLSGPTNLVIGSQGVYIAALVDSSLKGIPNVPVTLKSANGNTLAASSITTDGHGKSNFTLTATSAANSGKDVLTASALGQSQTASLAVSSDVFTITSPANSTSKVDLGFVQPVVANWKTNGTPKVGQNVSFAASRGALSASSAVTDANGNASVNISSTTAGQSVIDALGAGVSAQVLLDFVATNPTQLSLQANPASVPVQGSSTLTATVRDPKNNLVEGAVVSFSVADSTGGQLSVASVTTDVQGRAATTYTAGNTTSAGVGVTVTASVAGSTATDSAVLTVGGQSVYLTIGTGNTIDVLNEAQYQMQFAVQAVDAQGAALPKVPLTLSILPVSYVKGVRDYPDGSTRWVTERSTPAACPNEDTDYSGNISSRDPPPPPPPSTCTDLKTGAMITSHMKDTNCDGILWPGNIATVTPDAAQTDSTGTVIVLIQFPKDHAEWLTETLTATTVVAGTESSVSSTFLLPVLASDVTNKTIAPPGPVSPYGTAASCSDPR